MKTNLQILKEARELISVPERWTKKTFYRDAEGDPLCDMEDAVCFCTLGAIYKAMDRDILFLIPEEILDAFSMLGENSGEKEAYIGHFNDTHSHEEVLRKLDQAIGALERSQVAA